MFQFKSRETYQSDLAENITVLEPHSRANQDQDDLAPVPVKLVQVVIFGKFMISSKERVLVSQLVGLINLIAAETEIYSHLSLQ